MVLRSSNCRLTEDRGRKIDNRPVSCGGDRVRRKKKLQLCAKQLEVKNISGTVLLSHSQMYSTIAAGVLNYRVREGNVCFYSAMSTGKKYKERKC